MARGRVLSAANGSPFSSNGQDDRRRNNDVTRRRYTSTPDEVRIFTEVCNWRANTDAETLPVDSTYESYTPVQLYKF